ncbi:PAS domain S-box protein [Halorubellus sp. PRR65]|uniref:PAS domain S-box protein n=1 Tax=Halorubellus sp. PRR65 TaxID=3098148 RepID=UPI002B2612B0|nr:PAS domain S-box protein [Halorubellus sp. PRR65]
MASITPALAETLAVLERAAEPLSTSEVSDALDVGRRSTYDRLDRLSDGGHVRTKSVGASARIWWTSRPAADAPPGTGTGDTTAGVDGNAGMKTAGSGNATTASGGSGDPRVDDGTGSTTTGPSLRAAVDDASVGVATFDREGRVTFASTAFRAHLGLDTEADSTQAALEDVVLSVEGNELVTDPVEEFWTVVQDGHRRVRVEEDERWLAVGVHSADGDGWVATTRDVTRQVDWEAELSNAYAAAEQELAAFRSRAVDGFATVDEAGYVVEVCDRFARITCGVETDGTALLDQHVDTAFENAPTVRRAVTDSLETGTAASVEDSLAHDGRRFDLEALPIDHGVAVYLRDVTDRVVRERELRRYASLVDALGEPVYELNEHGEFTFVNDAAVEASGYSRAELLGSHVSIGISDDAVGTVAQQLADALGADDPGRLRAEYEVEPKDGDPFPVENRLAVLTDDDGRMTGTAGVLRDITERWERERELETYERIVETVEDGIYVLDDEGRFTFVNDAFASLLAAPVDDVVGAEAGDVLHDEFVEKAERALASTDGDERDTGRFQETVRATTGERFVADVQVSAFAFEDGRGRVGVLRDVTERVNRERKIESQRARLEALNEMNALVRDVASAAVEGSTREDIEALVCEELAAASSYAFAWIGGVESYDGTVSRRAEAGVEEYLSEVTIATDPSDPRSHGPVGRAIRERAVQTVQDAAEDPRFEPWPGLVDRHGFRSVAAIPITYEGALYGVLSVHSERENAFTGEERAAVERIGEFVGHAIAAVDRKRALTSEEVVELDYRVESIYDEFAMDVDSGGRIAFEETVRADDDELLVYGTVTEDARDALEGLVDAFDGWRSMTIVGASSDDGESRFELRTGNSPAYMQAMGSGGYIERATIEDGESRIVMHVPPETDVRAVTAAVVDAYPGAELVSKRQFSRPMESMTDLQRQVEASLTDRQRAVLEAAFYAGFFEWPRTVSGKDVASSLGVAPPTFSQHIRKAERKVFSLLLGSDRLVDDVSAPE